MGNRADREDAMDDDAIPFDPALALRRKADRLCFLIVASDYPDVDLDVEVAALRRWVDRWLPDRRELFELVYVSRFRRLRAQFRG